MRKDNKKITPSKVENPNNLMSLIFVLHCNRKIYSFMKQRRQALGNRSVSYRAVIEHTYYYVHVCWVATI